MQQQHNKTGQNSAEICRGCLMPIFSREILIVHPNTYWHPGCLRCVECHRDLQFETNCFLRCSRLPYCVQDFKLIVNKITRTPDTKQQILESKKCFICRKSIQPTSWYINLGLYRFHYPDCMFCGYCSRPIKPGQPVMIAMENNELLCRDHFSKYDSDNEIMEKDATPDEYSTTDEKEGSSDNDGSTDDGNNMSSQANLVQGSNIHMKRRLDNSNHTALNVSAKCPNLGKGSLPFSAYKHLSQSHSNYVSPSNHKYSDINQMHSLYNGKQTRMRTVLSESQLEALRACYANNPRPDSLTKEQLSFVTGLSCRVIRVWFQNKRCKDKKRKITEKGMVHSQFSQIDTDDAKSSNSHDSSSSSMKYFKNLQL